MSRKNDGINIISAALRAYADRGVFRSYSHKKGTGGKHEFVFVWLIEAPFVLSYNEKSNILTFNNLLPAVEKKSHTDFILRQFLKSRYSEKLPEHRRVEKEKIKLTCINKTGSVSIALKMLPTCDYAYGVNKAVNLVSDIFTLFFNKPENGVYVHDNFGIAGE